MFILPQVLPTTEYVTSRRNGPVKLRKDENGLGSEEPISIPSLLQVRLKFYYCKLCKYLLFVGENIASTDDVKNATTIQINLRRPSRQDRF